MNAKTILQPPALEIDKHLYRAPDHRPGPNTVLERRIVDESCACGAYFTCPKHSTEGHGVTHGYYV